MGFTVRSRFREIAEEERASLYHLNRERKHGIKNSLSSLKIGGQEEHDREKIESEVAGYFTALLSGHHNRELRDTGQPFQPDPRELPVFLQGLGQLCQASREKLEQPLVWEEVEHVMKYELEGNRSPGLDGISYEFYKATWDILGKDFFEVLQEQMELFNLLESNKHGVTRLISKVEGVPDVSQLRPITLLCTDYKILSKCFVRRMMPMMDEVITPGQLCGVGSKNIMFGVPTARITECY